MPESSEMSEPITRRVLDEELRKAVAPLATKDELREAVAKLATKDELREAVAKLATKEELREAVAKLATNERVDNLAAEMRAGHGSLLVMINGVRDQLSKQIADLGRQLAVHARTIQESVSAQIAVVDEKYKDLPDRVAALERRRARRR